MPKLLHTGAFAHTRLTKEAFRHRNFYSLFTRKLLHRSFCTEMPLQTVSFYTQKLLYNYSEKPLNRAAFTHTEAFTQRRFCTEKRFHRQAFAGRNFEHKRVLHTAAFTQRSLCADQLPSFYTQVCFHRAAFRRSSFYTPKLRRREAFTLRSFYAQRFSHGSFTQRNFYTEKRLNRAFTQKHLHAQKLYIHTELLHTDAFTHRSLFTEQGLHRAAFTHRSFYTERGPCTEQLIQSYTHRNFKHANAQAFTQAGLYIQRHLHKSSLHRCGRCFYTEAFEHRCLSTQKHLPRYALTWRIHAYTHRSL